MKKKKNTRNRKSKQRRIEQRQQQELLGKKSCDMKDVDVDWEDTTPAGVASVMSLVETMIDIVEFMSGELNMSPRMVYYGMKSSIEKEKHSVNPGASTKHFGQSLTSEQQLEVTLNQHQEFLELPQIDWTAELRKLEPKTGDATYEEIEEVKDEVKEVISVRSLPDQNRTHFYGPLPRKRVAA